MYHVLYDLETNFENLQQVEHMLENLILYPKIPITGMKSEDKTTPRICVAPTVEDCITAISIYGTFRRCANANPDAKSYENNDEVYPIIVIKLPDDLPYITPTRQQVSDAPFTHEQWLCEPFKPTNKSIKWLDQYSLQITGDRCIGINYIENLTGKHHPWLDKKGHPLDCSDMGGDTWPDNITKRVFHEDALKFLYWDKGPKQTYVYTIPDTNCYVTCFALRMTDQGLEQTGDIYRTKIFRVMKFTGYYDKNGKMLFEDDMVYYGEEQPRDVGRIERIKDQWAIQLTLQEKPVPLYKIAKDVELFSTVR